MKIFHLETINHVEIHTRISNQHSLPIIQFPERMDHILCIFGNGIYPIDVAINFIPSVLLSNRLRHLISTLNSLLEVAIVSLPSKGYYAHPLLQHRIYPPVELWLMFYLLIHGILHCLLWMLLH